jgi:hypothetical protein
MEKWDQKQADLFEKTHGIDMFFPKVCWQKG